MNESGSVVEVHLSDTTWQEASAQASQDGVSLEEWLRSLAERHIRETHYQKLLSREPQPEDFAAVREFLSRSPNVPPMPGDELPEGWSPEELR